MINTLHVKLKFLTKYPPPTKKKLFLWLKVEEGCFCTTGSEDLRYRQCEMSYANSSI